jgi:hypothetical protein
VGHIKTQCAVDVVKQLTIAHHWTRRFCAQNPDLVPPQEAAIELQVDLPRGTHGHNAALQRAAVQRHLRHPARVQPQHDIPSEVKRLRSDEEQGHDVAARQ